MRRLVLLSALFKLEHFRLSFMLPSLQCAYVINNPILAQTDRFTFKHFTKEDRLPSNVILGAFFYR